MTIDGATMRKLFLILLLLFMTFSGCKDSSTSPGTRTGAVCKDGTTTDATGSGACSHHGGVDHWLYK